MSESELATGAVVVAFEAPSPVRVAAEELTAGLSAAYEDVDFVVEERGEVGELVAGPVVHVGVADDGTGVAAASGVEVPDAPEGFAVTTAEVDGERRGFVGGADAAGVMYGVHRLLERLGHGAHLSFQAAPESTRPFDWGAWDLAASPATPRRLVLNWHNFLSGITAWDAAEWKQWIRQSQRMGYNGIVVHAYGNNPMAAYTFDGELSPVGYHPTSRTGREWGIQAVDDVRRLHGGDAFDGPVFGSEAASTGDPAARVEAARSVAREAFECAVERGVDVYFGVDVDTPEANPQSLIEGLPEAARFESQDHWLPRPDTEAGYAFFEARVHSLLAQYPQIDTLMLWNRGGGSPWTSLSREDLPEEWREEYDRICDEIGGDDTVRGPSALALGKIAAAFQRAAREFGREDVTVASGTWELGRDDEAVADESWRSTWVEPMHAFYPDDVTIVPLDYNVRAGTSFFDGEDRRAHLAEIASERPVVPFAWAHHDDEHHYGRPYAPLADFRDRLDEMNALDHGFGVIHWTTRPLDLYLKSTVDQTWDDRENEPLARTTERTAEALVGDAAAGPMADYLEDWVRTAPQFGRETHDRFLDYELPSPAEVRPGVERRLSILADVAAHDLSERAAERVAYFRGMERFFLAIHADDHYFNAAADLRRAGAYGAARTALDGADPASTIRQFASFSARDGRTRGEQGVLLSLNTRWLSHYEMLGQMVGSTPVRYSFGPTAVDPLAQFPGSYSFHVDPDGALWQVLGTDEVGYDTYGESGLALDDASPDLSDRPRESADSTDDAAASGDGTSGASELVQSGIRHDSSIEVTVGPSLDETYLGEPTLAPGRYRLSLLVPPVESGDATTVSLAHRVRTGTTDYRLREPTTAPYLRLAVTRTDDADPNGQADHDDAVSIVGVDGTGLDPSSVSVTASGHERPGREPARVVDGESSTRWVADGSDAWIQIERDDERPVETLAVDFHEGFARDHDVDVLASTDGASWTPVEYDAGLPPDLAWDSVDRDESAAAGFGRIDRQIDLLEPGVIDLGVRGEDGAIRLGGVFLERVGSVD